MNKSLKIFILITIILCVGVGSAFAFSYSKRLDEVLASILKGNYGAALDKCYDLEPRARGYIKGEVLHLEGVCLMEFKEYDLAREAFKKAIPYAKGDLAIEVYMGIADTYFMQYTYDKAIKIYDQMINKYANSDYMAMLYFKMGKAYQKKSKWVKSEYYFDKLRREFPRSFEAELVDKSSTGGNFFTVQVGCFTQKQNAQNLFSDLQSKGYQAYVMKVKSGVQKLYRVRVGKFVSRLAAEYEEEALRTKEHLPTHIFP